MTENVQDSIGQLFEAANSAVIVNAHIAPDADARLKEVLSILTHHIHAAIKEAKVTPSEWMAAIDFLTEVGQMCNDHRQEFILLSDVFGISMLVETVSHERAAGETENTVLGPFHLANAPRYENGADIRLDGKGAKTFVHGRVTDTRGNPVAAANIDVWSADDDGYYDVQRPGVVPDYNLRGQFTTDVDGNYSLYTAKPLHYPIPSDGPVGRLLTELGRSIVRPAHLHFIVSAPNFDTVVTHIFDPACPHLSTDPVFGVKKSLIADFKPSDGADGAVCDIVWDFVLADA